MPELSWAEWDAKAQYRCLHYKFIEQLDWLKDFYPEKIDRLQRWLADILAGHALGTEDEIVFLQEKITRLTDKFQTTLKEIEGRELGHFPNRPEHGTIYYIDLDNGNDGNTGLNATGQEWLTLGQYTTVSVRTPGDIAKVRANTTQILGGFLEFDESGTADAYIEIRGCSVADDPWGDASNVKPSLSFGDGNFEARPSGENYWKMNRMIFKESSRSRTFSLSTLIGWYFLDCELIDNSGGAGAGLYALAASEILIENCIFQDNLLYNLWADRSSLLRLKGCVFNGGGTTTDYGIYSNDGSTIDAIDCDFGQTTSHDIKDIYANKGGVVKTRNCKLDTGVTNGIGGIILSEDDDGTYGAGLITEYQGTITKDTGVKTGAATFSCKLEPNANCGPNNPLTLNRNSLIEFPFIIRCDTSVQKTVTIKIRSIDAWAVYPVAAELYIEALYLDHAVNASRTAIASTQVLSHASDWVSFTVTFTPLQTGVAYVAVYLAKFEAAKGCYVNMEAT